ncbi:MAG: cardiolipin synthase [Dehalococcoidia bacterium]|nr:cardiolipin synthase [Dehalococcoidia bacterium]
MGTFGTPFLLIELVCVAVAIFIVMENRSPQSTFAWAMALIAFPIVGLGLYVLFGRDLKAFSRARKLVRQDVHTESSLAPAEQHAPAHAIAQLEDESRTVYKRRLLRLARNNSNSALTVRNRLALLQDADEAYPQLVADIIAARHSIHLEFYIWASDAFTERLKVLLAEKVRSGVEVRLLFDPIGSFTDLRLTYIREMRALGIDMRPFSPLYRIHTVGYRNHRKIAVIDGQVGHLGGMNIGQETIDGGGEFDRWRDTQVRIEGDAVISLQNVFAVDWYNATGQRIEVVSPPADSALDEAYLPVQITTSGPDSEWEAIRQLYFYMILSAEHHVYLQSPFFILDTSIAEALKAAALAGVDIRIMIAERGAYYQVPYWAANTYAREMVAAGVRVYLYRGGYLHAKAISIDGEICSVGSANMDNRSFSINYEINAIIYDRAVAEQLERTFTRDLERCVEFDGDDYDARNVLVRLRDSTARLLSPLL